MSSTRKETHGWRRRSLLAFQVSRSQHDELQRLYPRLKPFWESKTHVVTWIDPPCPPSGNFSRLHTVLDKINVTDGKAAPRNTTAEYDGIPSDCSIICKKVCPEKVGWIGLQLGEVEMDRMTETSRRLMERWLVVRGESRRAVVWLHERP